MQYLRMFVGVVAALLLDGCSGGSGGAGGDGRQLRGVATTLSGTSLSSVTISDVRDPSNTAITDSLGKFTISARSEPASDGRRGALLRAELAGYAPFIVFVPEKAGVASYDVPVKLAQIQSMSVEPGMVNLTDAKGNPVLIDLSSMNAGGMRLDFAAVTAEDAPGVMKEASAPEGKQLQSLSMFYLSIKDALGQDMIMPPDGVPVSLPMMDLPELPDAEPLGAYRLNDAGFWDPMGEIAAGTQGGQFSVREFGFWNADRNFRTACVTGKVVTSGGACGGGRVQSSGPDGISSSDWSGADGSFCVMGAQRWTSALAIGGFSKTVQMPSTAGDCAVPETCAELETIMIDADDCSSEPPTAPPPSGGCLERIRPLRMEAEACGEIEGSVLGLEQMCEEEACSAEVDAVLTCLESSGLSCYNQCAEYRYFQVNSPSCDSQLFDYRDCLLGFAEGTSAMSSGDDPEPLYDIYCP